MPAVETVELRFLAEIGDLKSELSKMPGIGKAEATKLVKELEKQYARAEKAAKKMAADSKDSAEKTAKGLEGVKNAAEGLGGAFGATAGTVEKMIQSAINLGSAIGPVGAAIGGATVGVGLLAAGTLAVASALAEFMTAADASIKRLEEISGAEPIPASSIDGVDQWRQAALGAEAAGERLKVILAGELGRAFSGAADLATGAAIAMADLIEYVGDLTRRFEGTIDVVGNLVRIGQAMGTLGLSEAVRALLGGMADEGHRAAEGIRDLSSAMDEANRAAESFIALQEGAILAMTGATDAEIKHFQALENVDAETERLIELRREAGDLTKGFEQAIRGSADAIKEQITREHESAEAAKRRAEAAKRAADASRIEAEAAAEVNEILRMEAENRQRVIDASEILRQLTAEMSVEELSQEEQIQAAYEARIELIHEQMRLGAELDASQAAMAAAETERLHALDMLEQQQHRRELARIKTEQAALEARQQAAVTSAQALLSGISDFSGAISDLIVEGGEEMTMAGWKQAKALFRVEQAAAITSIGISTAVAITRALAELGPIAGAVAGIGIGITGVAQAAVVMGKKPPPPPEFPMGGLVSDRMGMQPYGSATPDHVLIGARPDERILSPGESARQAPTLINLHLDRRIIAEAVADVAGSGLVTVSPGRVTGRVAVYGGG